MKNLNFILAFFFSVTAVAIEAPRQSEDIVFDIPKGELSLPAVNPQEITSPHYIGLEFSSWEPDQFQQESRLPMTTDFVRSGSNKATLSYVSAGADTSLGLLSLKLGVSYMQLKREGQLAIETIGYTVSQKTNLYQVALGTEWKTYHEYFAVLKPYANIAILPTWVQSQKSEFNGGISTVEWPLYFSAGGLINVHSLGQWLGVDEMALNLSIEKTQNLSGSSLNGTGVALGTRIGWN